MGTSSIFNGKKDKNPLLPDDFHNQPDGTDKPQIPNLPQVKWQTVKSDMSKYVRSGGQSGSVKHITKQYVRASGGTKQILREFGTGIRTAHTIGNILYGIKSDGLEKTFRALGIEYSGKSVHEVFSNLVNVISPFSENKEDIVAKKAAQEALVKIYQFVEANEMSIASLDSMPDILITQGLCEYVSSYIWLKMMNDLESRFEKYMSDTNSALSLENEFKQYIFNTVQIEFNKQSDFLTQDIHAALTSIYENCYKVLEGTI